jgi:multidrug resistance efflux pump
MDIRELAPILGLGFLAACAGVEADPPTIERSPVASAASAHRGDFETHLLLTGVLEAVRSTLATAPNVPASELQIRWMEEDGAYVRAGQKVLEFENDTFAGVLEDLKLTRSKEEKELGRLEAQSRADAAEKAFAVLTREVELEKARLEADVPPEILPFREFQEKQLALERARTELEKAREELEAHRRTQAEEKALKELQLEKTIHDIRAAEEAVDALSLEAPIDGILVVASIPWEDRKLQVGDNVWQGFPLFEIPDLAEMRVRALLSDVDDGRLRTGMTAVVTLDAHPDVDFPGEIESITPVAQETSPRSLRRSFTVEVRLTRTDPARMRPGMAVRVRVTTGTKENVLLAPRSAVDFERTPDAVCNLFECVIEDDGR